MKMNIRYIAFFSAATLLMSCGGDANDSTSEGTEVVETEAVAPECTYSLGDSSTSVYWTAYKHTEKIAVKGRMDSLTVSELPSASSPMEALARCEIVIYTSGVNSNDAVRDKKLQEIYFGSMASTNGVDIFGVLLSSEGSNTEGTCEFMLTMNDKGRIMSGNYTVEDHIVQLRFTIEPKEWGTEDAIAKLGEACAEKHTGEDGKTVFWPDVDILIEVVLDKDCPDPA